MGGNFIKRFCTIAWCLTAIAALAWYTRRGADLTAINPDNVYGAMAQAFLPNAMPGLLGLFMAAMLAGIMSSCDCFMLAAAALFTQNLYKPLVPTMPDRHYLWVGRIASFCVVVGGVAFALWVPNVVRALEIWFQIAPMMGIVFWIGLLWRRMTVAGAWAATAAGFATWWLTERDWFIHWVSTLEPAQAWRLVWTEGQATEIYLPWQIVAYMTVASATGILVSLVSNPVPREKLDLFYTLTRTPIAPGEKIIAPCTIPEGVTPPYRPMLITKYGLEIPVPSRTSVVGFALGWLLVGALIAGFVLLVR